MRHHPALHPAAAVSLAVALALPLAVTPAPATHPVAASAAPSASPPPSEAATAVTGPDVQAEIASATAEATPGGPRPTSIRLSDDDARTTVLVHGLGSASAAQARENRAYRHSDLQPTARFAATGDELTITVPEGAPALSVSIGLYGVHGEQNGGVERGRWTTPLTEGVNTVTSPLDGMVHLVSTVDGGSADVAVEGGQAVPHFVAGQTTNEQLRAEMARLSDAPFVQVIGDRFFGDFQTRYTGSVIAVADMEARVAELDRAIEITNHAYGLLDEGTGLARKAPHRVYVAAPDTSGGYANAGAERVAFPVRSGAAGDLFRAPSWDQWGWWHEIGHTYQTPTINWGGQGEVFVNMSALHVQTQMGWAPRLDGQVGAFDAFFAMPVDQRAYMSNTGLFLRLFLYDQLRRGFGDEFWPRLNQELRVMKTRGDIGSLDAEGQRQLFAVTAARVTDRDLSEFFREWGFPLSDETRAAMAELPALEQPIWQNRHSSNLIREYEMTPYSVPVGTLATPDETVVVGQRQLANTPTPVGLGDSDGDGGARALDHVVTTLTPGTGSVGVTVVNDLDVREVFTAPVDVTPGTSFQFRGASDRVVAALALPEGSDELRLIAGTTYQSHSSFGGREYVGATVYDARGRETASFSIDGYATAYPSAAAFDGTRFTDGMHLTVRHREANSRSTRWDADTQVPRNGATTQHYRYDAGRLVPVTEIPVVSALDAVSTSEPLELRRGTTTDATITLETTERVTGLTADLVVTAPARTTLTEAEEALVTEVRLPGGEWVTTDDLTVTSTSGADGRSVTLTVTGADGLDLPTGTQLRWTVAIAVPAGTHTVGTGLDWTITGSADGETVTARG